MISTAETIGAHPAAQAPGAKAVELRDLARIPLWLLSKPLYAVAPVSFHFRLAALLGRLEWRRSPLRAAAVAALEEHLDAADAAERELVCRRHFEFRSRGRFTRTWPQVRGFRGSDAIRVEGLEHLDAALADGRGALIVTGHFGYARLVKPILRATGRSVLLVGPGRRPGRKDMPPHLTRLGSFVHTSLLRLPRASHFDDRWQRTVGEDLPTGLNLRPLIAALGRNEALVILADGRVAQALRPVTLGGIRMYLAPGAMSLARETGAAVLPTFVVDDPDRTGPDALRLVVHPPLELQVTGDLQADLCENLGRFAAVWEQQLRTHPHNFHWTWVRDGVFGRLD